MTALTRASFDSPQETRNFDPPDSGHLELVADGAVGRATFNPGCGSGRPMAPRWSTAPATTPRWSRAMMPGWWAMSPAW